MAAPNKKYGLFLPKNKKSTVKTTNVFDDDSDDDLPGMALVNATINKEANKSKVKRQTQIAIDQALEQDPNIYEYDKIYDVMTNTRSEAEERAKAKKDNKPKYIAGLLKAAEKRKLEQEKVQEKKIQKERETEGGEFADKEVFVTGKYKEKLQEMEREAERERREAAMEELLDVKKQKDMSGFYRYLLNEKTGQSIHNGDPSATMVKTEPETEADISRVKTEPVDKGAISNRTKHSSSSSSSSDSSDSEETDTRHTKLSKGRNQKSRSPKRRDRSRSPMRRQRSRSRDRRRSRSPYLSHRDRENKRSYDSASQHRRSRRSRSNDRHSDKYLQRDRKKRSSSKDRISKSSEQSVSNDIKTKDKRPRSKERYTERQEERDIKNTEQSKESGKSEKVNSESEMKSKYAKHTTDKSYSDAKARYLARQIAKSKARPQTDTSGAS
ncbi:nuclear speckle splicing regulatory protein 1-like [Ylistrum balloti]|uniref:nuclear speckle splicing regulatory protein 1-like n=1 Tax=Ylistrum balloti TaxID=509963 RepID=UPI0029059DFF|nr:nuclear speckle splicing regulatory protein 1-like [Ylistrum balloti]